MMIASSNEQIGEPSIWEFSARTCCHITRLLRRPPPQLPSPYSTLTSTQRRTDLDRLGLYWRGLLSNFHHYVLFLTPCLRLPRQVGLTCTRHYLVSNLSVESVGLSNVGDWA